MKTQTQSFRKLQVPRLVKVIYGSGDWGVGTFNTLRLIFYAIFLTDVVGLEPRLASFAAFFGIVWDAINDPLVGVLSDKVKSRWGRRRPFLLFFAVPYGLAFMMLWWAPPWEHQGLLMLYVMIAYALSDTFQTLVIVPFHALTPEMTTNYDERTSLASYRMFFNLLASILTAVAAPMVIDATMAAGGTQQQGYLLAATLLGLSSILPYLLIFATVRERTQVETVEIASFRETMRIAWQNIPFRYATVIYMLNWVTFDLIGVVLPYFLIYWVGGGDLMVAVPGLGVPLESGVLGVMLVTATCVLPFWTWLAHRLSKRIAYMMAIGLWAILLLLLTLVPPQHITLTLIFAALIGVSVSAGHVLPDAIFPDVIDWDELRTGKRYEGVYYGAKNFIRKMTTAFAIFLTLQALGWLGYQAPPEGATTFSQPPAAILGIRALIGPIAAALLIVTMVVTWFYPITRRRYHRIQRLLTRRQAREPEMCPGQSVATRLSGPTVHSSNHVSTSGMPM